MVLLIECGPIFNYIAGIGLVGGPVKVINTEKWMESNMMNSDGGDGAPALLFGRG